MDIHQNARTTPHSRAALVRRVKAGELPKTVAAGMGVCDKTVRKWAGRFSREGAGGLADRSSRPHRLRCPTAPAVAEQVVALRRQRLLMKHIAAQLELSIATVSRLLKRACRAALVRRVKAGELPKTVAAGMGVCDKTVRKWAGRFSREGAGGLADRSSRPHRLRCPTAPAVAEQVVALRRQRLLMKHIAAQLELSIATVSRLLKRACLSRLSALDPPLLIQRYEYAAPGDLLHLDTKKLGRFHRVGSRITGTHQKRSLGAGYEVTHICIDDYSRLAYIEVLPNERKETTTGFLSRALDHYQALGISVTRIMTDNGSAYRSHLIADLCRSRRMRHIFTRPYTPRTNGKAERFIQTALREWAYARSYDHSQQRADALVPWLHSYNYHRPHQGIGGRTPISRLPRDNLLQIDT